MMMHWNDNTKKRGNLHLGSKEHLNMIWCCYMFVTKWCILTMTKQVNLGNTLRSLIVDPILMILQFCFHAITIYQSYCPTSSINFCQRRKESNDQPFMDVLWKIYLIRFFCFCQNVSSVPYLIEGWVAHRRHWSHVLNRRIWLLDIPCCWRPLRNFFERPTGPGTLSSPKISWLLLLFTLLDLS